MNEMKKRFALFLLVMVSPLVSAQLYSSKINFQHVLENKDVVLGVTLSLHQDNDGFIWMGGESALIRYDGYEFKTIGEINGNDPSAKPKTVGVVPHIFEDSQGILWVATIKGLLWYDKSIELLRRLPDHESLKALPLSSVGARRVAELDDGRMAVSTFGGVYIVDRKTGEGRLLRTADGLSPGRINTIAAAQGYLWIGTASGLDRFDPTDGAIKNFRPYHENPESEPDNGVSSILFSQDGTLWLGTDRGLMRFNPETLAYKRYRPIEGDNSSFSGGDIWWLSESKDGYLWIATDGGGLNMFDPVSEKFVRFRHETGRLSSLNSNVVRTVIEDSNGDLWVGNYPNGVNFFDKSSAAINAYTPDASDPLSLSHISVMDVALEPSGNLWVGTDGGGLNYFDRDKQAFTYYGHQKDDPNTIGAPAVLGLFLDSQGILWGGTWAGGAFTVDTQTHKISRLPHDAKRAASKAITHSKKLNNDKVWCIYEDSQGAIWLCTHEGGLNKYNRDTGEFTHYIETSEPGSLSSNQVWTVYEDSHGVFWVGTVGGLNILDRETGKFTAFIPDINDPESISNPSVLSIYEDSKGRMWFGTNEGLNLYDREMQSFARFGKADDFFDDSIRSIIEDPKGNLWMGTNSGVVMFEPDTKRVKNYNRESGKLIGGFNYTAAVMTEDAEAIFGGKKGLRIYKTDEIKDNEFLPPVVFTDLKVNSEPVKIKPKFGILNKSINLTDELILDYTQSIIEIDFAALGFRDSGKNQYSYMLQGFDAGWVDAGTERKAKYTNLDAGTYVLRVKASNNDGVWNDEEKTLRIVQRPPPWETWWAYTLYVCILLLIVAHFIHKQRQKRRLIEEQNRLLEAKVNERTKELAAKNNDIQAMLGNMRQGLFTVQPDGGIHPEYSAYLEKIFNTREIAGCSAVDLLFDGADIGGDAMNQAREALKSIIGEDEMNFTFNAHVLPTEYKVTRNEKPQYLSLVWDPIIKDGLVEKLMVSVRDVTALREAEAEAQSQKRELDIIAQVIKIPEKKYLSFEESAQQFIAENRREITEHNSLDRDVVDLLFRNMHTIKGNCRTYGMQHCSDVVHDVETYYSELQKGTDGVWDKARLLADLERVEAAINEYHKVYHWVLGRGGSDDELRVRASILHSTQRYICRAFEAQPALKSSTDLQSAKLLLNITLSSPLSEVVEGIVSSLPSIAEQLNKASPKVVFNDQNMRIRISAYEVINNVFAHILRNSLDHGIEPSDERKALGKSESGHITVTSSQAGNGMSVTIADDGRGINVASLFNKGVEMQRWRNGDDVSVQAMADLIFVSGASTKTEVSDISGRGVGMDAVKRFLEKIGGSIRVHLLADSPNEQGCIPFETVITLPPSCYVEIAYQS
ncbi:MAG TPA: two-component regulator propeller domain-containing protein [Marinagarivorans sp.]